MEDGRAHRGEDLFRSCLPLQGGGAGHGNLSEGQMYLRGREQSYTGPNGLQAANHLTDSLKANGIEMYRFKTGTPARVDREKHRFFQNGGAVRR